MSSRSCLTLECCQVFIEQQFIKSATLDLTRTCSWPFRNRLKHVWATLPSSYCMRFGGKMCNVERTALNTCISACSQVSPTQFLILYIGMQSSVTHTVPHLVYRHAVKCHSHSSSSLPPISWTYRMSLLIPKDHNHLVRHPFFVLCPTDSEGTVTFQSPTGQTTFTLFQQQCPRHPSQSRHGTVTN
jgi:hypothetical protein